MSDLQQGPGWWLASDGKWYPPESRPQPLPPPPVASPYGGAGPYPYVGTGPHPYVAPPVMAQARSVAPGLTGTIQGFLWAAAGLSAVAAVMALVALGTFNSYWNTPINSRAEADAYDTWRSVDDGFGAAAGFVVLCGFVVWILLMVWMNSAHKTTRLLWHGQRRWTSGWTVGGWFIPVANAVIPKLVLSEIEQIALAPRRDGRVETPAVGRRPVLIGTVWWVCLVAGTVLNGIGNAIGSELDASRGEVRAGYVCNSLGFTILAVSGALGALYIRRIGSRLSPHGLTDSP